MEAIGTLAGGIAHDFNNILTGILGNAEMARLELAEGHPARQFLAESLAAAERARNLVAQILTFSRRREQQRAVLALAPVVEEALRLLRASLPATIELCVSLREDVPAVLADPTQVHQVLMNLGANAAHALRARGGRIEIFQNLVELPAEQSAAGVRLPAGRYVRLAVRDNGHGMDAATRERIFEPFFTTKPPGHGTGLGLAVVHGIMESHDGAITVDSAPDEGAIFHLYFPAIEAEPAANATDELIAPRGRGQRILVVDDEPVVARLATRILERLGYRATAFLDPVEAVAAFRADPDAFDLVLTDLTMPHLTGVEVASDLLRLRPTLPIILSTGFSGRLNEADARRFGIRAMLGKPYTVQSLAEAVQRVLSETSRAS